VFKLGSLLNSSSYYSQFLALDRRKLDKISVYRHGNYIMFKMGRWFAISSVMCNRIVLFDVSSSILIIGSMATTIPSTKSFLFLFFCNLAFQDLRAFFG
jgi:hypothetical protein